MHGDTIDVPSEAIELEWTDYPREGLDENRILEFRELLRDPQSTPLPPIELVPHPTKPGRFLAPDGWHRIHAHRDEGRLTIPAVILPPETDVFVHAVQRAAITAKPLTRVEKRAAVTRLLTEHPDWSNHRIADVAAVSRPFVANLRAQGNVAPTDEGQAETEGEAALPVRRGLDPAQHALRLLITSYTDGYGRTRFGFGKAVSPRLIRRHLEGLGDDACEQAVPALRAWLERSNLIRHVADLPLLVVLPDGGISAYLNWKHAGLLWRINASNTFIFPEECPSEPSSRISPGSTCRPGAYLTCVED